MPGAGRVAAGIIGAVATVATDRSVPTTAGPRVQVQLLGSFAISVGAESAGPWTRLSAKRLLELVFLSPKRRITKEVASDTLFPDLAPRAATNAMYNALSAARAALADLGGPATGVLRTDRTHIYIPDDAPVLVDLEFHERALSTALEMPAGDGRDAALVEVLSEERVLLEDEAYSDWALRPRESLELARQDARLALARGRSLGLGRSGREDVIEALGKLCRTRPCLRGGSCGTNERLRRPGPTPPGGPGLPAML
jgi:DNA-binding SARP family transcriptional activator